MKTKQTYIRIIALAIFTSVLISNNVFSQGTDSRRKYAREGKIYAGLMITPQMTSIKNNDIAISNTLAHKSGMSFNLALEGGYFFSKNVGVSIGAGMGSYSTDLTLDSCSIKFQDTDSDLEDYEMRIKGKQITETQNLSFLSIPVCLIIKIPAGEKVWFHAKAGLSFDIPVVKKYDGNGTFSYSGYYSAYPVLLEGIPVYFPSNVATSSSGTLAVKSFSQTLVASAGATYNVTGTIGLTLGVYFNRSLGNISTYTTGNDNLLTSEPNEMKTIMGSTSSAGVQAIGISVGLRYYLR
jgi:hypothetical protein